jgi:dTDP-4-dehydrorhamnose 3,5-epimerase
MGKLMRVTYDSTFLVAVDIRKESPTLGKWFGLERSAENRKQVRAPAGFARGFCALSDYVDVQTSVRESITSEPSRAFAGMIQPSAWSGRSRTPVLSEKYRRALTLAEWLATPESDHFGYV